MPYKSEKLRLPEEYDRRVKLTASDKEEVRRLREEQGLSYNHIASMFGVSKKLVIMTCNPEILERERQRFIEAKRAGKYKYTKEYRARAMRNTRRYKQELHKEGII